VAAAHDRLNRTCLLQATLLITRLIRESKSGELHHIFVDRGPTALVSTSWDCTARPASSIHARMSFLPPADTHDV
jgi:hypothetical protein